MSQIEDRNGLTFETNNSMKMKTENNFLKSHKKGNTSQLVSLTPIALTH